MNNSLCRLACPHGTYCWRSLFVHAAEGPRGEERKTRGNIAARRLAWTIKDFVEADERGILVASRRSSAMQLFYGKKLETVRRIVLPAMRGQRRMINFTALFTGCLDIIR